MRNGKLMLALLCGMALTSLSAAVYTLKPGDSLDAVNQKVKPGDTVILKAGKHTGTIRPARSGEKGKPIVYRGEKGAALHGVAASAIELAEKSHITVENLSVTVKPGVPWYSQKNGKYITVRNCTFTDAANLWAPFSVHGAEYCRYEDITADGCLKSPDKLTGHGGFTGANLMDFHDAKHCVFLRLHTLRGGHTPFVMWNTCSDNVVRECIFDSRWARNFEFFNAQNILIERCAVVNAYHGASSADTGAKLFVHGSIFRRNVIVNNADGPLVANSYTYPGYPPFSIRDSRVYFNTWSANGSWGLSLSDFRNPNRVVNNVFKNNIWAGNNPGGDPVAFQAGSNIQAKENRFRGNVIFGRQPGDKVIWRNGFRTLSELVEAEPEMFSGNFEFDPQFADPEHGVFAPVKTSPAIDRGEHLTTTRSAGSGRVVEVADARYFFDGFGIPGEVGDEIVIGGRTARVTARDVEKNTLTLDRPLSWKAGDFVDLPYAGKAPDLGAYELGLETGPSPKVLGKLRVVPSDYYCDFEPEHFKNWAAWWFAGRQGPSAAALELAEPAAKGKGSIKILYVYRHEKFADRVLAVGQSDSLPAKPSCLSCYISPPNWKVADYPFVKFFYRIPKDVPVGITVRFFDKADRPKRIYLGGSPAYTPGDHPHTSDYALVDDGEWHEITIDLRKALKFAPDTGYIRDFGFRTESNGKPGQWYWFDEFRICPR